MTQSIPLAIPCDKVDHRRFSPGGGPDEEDPVAELLFEHCFAENALRVTWVMPGTCGSAPADLRLLAATAASEPR